MPELPTLEIKKSLISYFMAFLDVLDSGEPPAL
jgi:hypothetical protein